MDTLIYSLHNPYKLIIANVDQFISMWHYAMILQSKILSQIKYFLVSLNKYVYFIIFVWLID